MLDGLDRSKTSQPSLESIDDEDFVISTTARGKHRALQLSKCNKLLTFKKLREIHFQDYIPTSSATR